MGLSEDLLDAFDEEDAEAFASLHFPESVSRDGQEVKDLLGRVEAWIAKLLEHFMQIPDVNLFVLT